MKVIVVGGGISGLTMAMSLNQIGVDVRVYEAVREVTPLGVGINVQPNAVRELIELGLGERLAEIGIATEALSFFNKFGQTVWSEKRGRAAGFAWPQYSIHRGRLQVMMVEATRERIGDALRTGHVFQHCVERGDKIVATFADRNGAAIAEDEADILIGADGIHSAVRRQFYPEEGEPNFAGQILWRAAVETAPFLGGATMAIAGHFHQRIVAYPMARSSTTAGASGKLLTNWIAQMTVDTKAPPREDWNRKVDKSRFIDAFRDWRFDWLDFPGLVEKTAEIFEFPLVDRHPVERWSFGRVTLIGDAAHPMQPT
ncbi:MAG TPA: FAD-dependent monooxygenase, partial [Stellaceae bacterium]|nr:FAD-dependent monooxygenase [Stellaceae bacterium]